MCNIFVGKRNGKGLAAATAEVMAEVAELPTVGSQEALEFLRVQIRRATLNRNNAVRRKDRTAEGNLSKKLAVYEYLKGLVENTDKG